MTLNRRMILAGSAGLLAAPALVRAQAVPPYAPDPNVLRITTGGPAGNYHSSTMDPKGGILAFLGDAFPRAGALTSAGSLENLRRLRDGQADMGWVQEDVLIDFTKTDLALRRALPVFRVMYVELVQFFAAKANRWDSLADMAKAGGELGIGREGSGLNETWRILTTVNKDAEKAYGKITAVPVGADYNRFVEIRDTRGMAQGVLEGPGSDNSAVANEVSAPQGGDGQLTLLDVADSRWDALKRLDGEPLYKTVRLKPRAAVARTRSEPAQPGFYDKLLPSGGIFSSAGVATLGVRCLLLIRADYRAALPSEKQTRLGRAIDQALGGIRKRVNPFSIDL